MVRKDQSPVEATEANTGLSTDSARSFWIEEFAKMLPHYTPVLSGVG